MTIPKKQHKLIRGLSDFVCSHLEKTVKTKEDILDNLNPNLKVFTFGEFFDSILFKKTTKNFTEQQWQKLIQSSNSKIGIKLKDQKREEIALNKLLELVEQDNFLKSQNISIVELVRYDKNYFGIKVYFICGAYFLEGSLKELVIQIREILKEENVSIRAFCPSCSGKNLRFADIYCLCNECGALSILEENKVVKQYKQEDKQFWWAKALADMHSIGA